MPMVTVPGDTGPGSRRDFERDAGRTADTPAGMEIVASLLPDGAGGREALLPLLHAMMAAFGYIDDALVPAIARTLNLSRADVHGVVTFYHDFRRRPPGRRFIRICRAESCRARGAMAVERALVAGSGVAVGDTSADGSLTIDRVHCFGLCATGPNLEVDGRFLSRVRGAVIGWLQNRRQSRRVLFAD